MLLFTFPLQRGMKEFEWPRSTWPPREESGVMMAARQTYESTGQTVEEQEAESRGEPQTSGSTPLAVTSPTAQPTGGARGGGSEQRLE